MADFKNISPNKDAPFYFNADEICTIIRWETDNGPEMSFYSRTEGGLLRKSDDGHYLNGGDAVSSILGDTRIDFPLIRDGQKYATAYFSPDAFDYIISSSPYSEGNKQERLTNVMIGLDGTGRLESHGVSVDRLGELVRSLKQTHKTLNTILPTQGKARFYNPGFVTLNPHKIDRIKADSTQQVWVYFNQTDGIDFQIPRKDNFVNDRANELYKHDPGRDITEIFNQAKEENVHRQDMKVQGLIRAVTRKTDHLTAVNGHAHPFLVRPDMIRSMEIHSHRSDKDTALTLTYTHNNNRWPESDHLVFDKTQDALKALTALRQAANSDNGGPSTQQRGPDAPRPPMH